MKRCPLNSAHQTFEVQVLAKHIYRVDQNGDYLADVEFLEVLPYDDEEWKCATCGALAVSEDAESFEFTFEFETEVGDPYTYRLHVYVPDVDVEHGTLTRVTRQPFLLGKDGEPCQVAWEEATLEQFCQGAGLGSQDWEKVLAYETRQALYIRENP